MIPKIDTRIRQETPEGVELAVAPAGPGVRAVAWAIDFGIRTLVYMAAGFAVALLGNQGGSGLMMIGMFLLEWAYPVFFEVTSGSTPGKRAVALAVVHDDGTPIDLGASLLRNLIRFVDFMPIGYLFGLVSCLVSRRFQRLGDLAAGTLVVHVHRARPEVLPGGEGALCPQVSLTLDEQQAVVAFASRARLWTVERQRELAARSGVCTSGSDGARVAQLRGFARWIAGQR